MAFRLDKYIWAVRLTKTRSQATELISKGRIKLNQSNCKPAKEPKIGDHIQVVKNTAVFSFKVLQLLEKRVGAKLVDDYILNITPPEEIEKFKQYQLAQSTYREYGTGRPTKHDRKEIDDFLSWDESDWD